MFYLMCVLIGAVSPVFPVVSVEAFAVFIGLFAQDRPFWAVALACAFGQLLCFLTLYLAGHRWVARLPWIRRRLAHFDPGRYQLHARLFYATAATVGFPPLNLLSIAAPILAVGPRYFVPVVFFGRWARLCALVFFAEQFRDWVSVDDLPEWLRARL
ncbi:MAG: hypothetical protein ACOYM9_18525 [Bradymonadia bacterium]